MTDYEYSLKFPKTPVVFMDETLTFAIYKMKSRLPSAVYFILHLYDEDDKELTNPVKVDGQTIYGEPVYILKNRWVVDDTYSTYHETFDIPLEFIEQSVYYQIELRTYNVTSENPLYFREVMFNEGEFELEHHVSNEAMKNVDIGFNKSSYANLYNDTLETYLQVIRPNRDAITTGELTGSSCTVLAPHIPSESSVDDPINLFLEFINQTDQRIDVLR